MQRIAKLWHLLGIALIVMLAWPQFAAAQRLKPIPHATSVAPHVAAGGSAVGASSSEFRGARSGKKRHFEDSALAMDPAYEPTYVS